MKTKIYWRVRPDRENGTDDFVYFQIHIKFGPLDPNRVYYSRPHDDPHNRLNPPDKKVSSTYKKIWKNWEYIEVDFDPLKVVRVEEGNPTICTWWAFDVEFDFPKHRMDYNETNCKIKSIKQSNFPHRKLIPEDYDYYRGNIKVCLCQSKDDGVNFWYIPKIEIRQIKNQLDMFLLKLEIFLS